MDELGRNIGRDVREALEKVLGAGPTRVAVAANRGRARRTAVAYSDDHITVVTSDGEATVIHHHGDGSS